MGIEQSDKLKSAPVQALRAVFSSVGQLFLAADKIKTQARERTAEAGQAVAARQAATRKTRSQPRRPDVNRVGPAADARARTDSRWRSLDQTGNVRLLTAEEVAEAVNDRPAPPPEHAGPAVGSPTAVFQGHRGAGSAQQTPSPPSAATTGGQTSGAQVASAGRAGAANGHQPAGQQAAAELPVANYDALSLPSLRARLRTLDEAQLAQLTKYERAHAARADVLSMFENRIAKLRNGG